MQKSRKRKYFIPLFGISLSTAMLLVICGCTEKLSQGKCNEATIPNLINLNSRADVTMLAG